MDSKKKCSIMFLKLMMHWFEDAYSGDGYKDSCKSFFATESFSESFSDLKNAPHAEKVNEYVASIMQSLAKESLDNNRDKVFTVLAKDISEFIDNLLTEEEAEELYTFGMSETGQKVFRNLDLFKKAVARARSIIVAEIVAAWSGKEVEEKIIKFIEDLEDGDD